MQVELEKRHSFKHFLALARFYVPIVLFGFDELSGLLQAFRSIGSELEAPSMLDAPLPLLDGPFVTLLENTII